MGGQSAIIHINNARKISGQLFNREGGDIELYIIKVPKVFYEHNVILFTTLVIFKAFWFVVSKLVVLNF